MNKEVIVIVGPTAVGKTRLGVELALKLNGEVISGDSMQVYKGMDIGTAKVTFSETKGIKHHLIDILEPNQSYSVANFQIEVRKLIDDIYSRGKVPIIVGGTGLYIKAALYDYKFDESNNDYYVDYCKKYEQFSNLELYNKLLEIDPESCKKIHVNNRQRVVRALEIYYSTGKTKSEQEASQEHKPIYNIKIYGLTIDRDILYKRINQRVDLMIENGLKVEVRNLIDKGYTFNLQAMKGIGYKEWSLFFNGNLSLEETVELIKKNSRNFAKRQYTWFNNQMNVKWVEVDLNDFDKTILNIYQNIIE